MDRQHFLDLIKAERERQLSLPGSEWDQQNTPNDWCAIAGTYLLRETYRKSQSVAAADYTDSMVKAAAVILAALEYIPTMVKDGFLK